jgi:hypothetical protein
MVLIEQQRKNKLYLLSQATEPKATEPKEIKIRPFSQQLNQKKLKYFPLVNN